MSARKSKHLTYFAVDSGTTNTTVWLMNAHRILCDYKRPVGVRQTSISGNRHLLESTLRNAFRSLRKYAPTRPKFVLAAGMLTSPLGLLEVPHVPAPAGLSKLAGSVRMKIFARVSDLPFFLVPGVRIGGISPKLSHAPHSDIIRGEETEVIGFQRNMAHPVHRPPWVLLHVGSHAKAIAVDAQGRIVRSATTLSGELLNAVRTQTILASRLRHVKSEVLRRRFFQKGATYSQRYGLSRTFFLTRLLEGNARYRQQDLYSFLLGSLVASDLQTFRSLRLLEPHRTKIILTGQPSLQSAWKLMIENDYDIEAVTPEGRVQAFLTAFARLSLPAACIVSFAARVSYLMALSSPSKFPRPRSCGERHDNPTKKVIGSRRGKSSSSYT